MSATIATNNRSQHVKLFKALGDENRFLIVQMLTANRNFCVSEVAQAIGITPAGVSQHMRILVEAGLVEPKRNGQRICYKLQNTPNNRSVINYITRTT